MRTTHIVWAASEVMELLLARGHCPPTREVLAGDAMDPRMLAPQFPHAAIAGRAGGKVVNEFRTRGRNGPPLGRLRCWGAGFTRRTGLCARCLCTVLLLISLMASAEQPYPGPGPVSPGPEIERPPVISPAPEQPIEVPIGRLEGYEEEKRKPQGVVGRPPGTVQEDPAAARRGTEPGSCNGRERQ